MNFDEMKFYNDFHNIISKYSRAEKLIRELEDNGEIIIFGGAVRDYLESNFETMPRDFDIVFKRKRKDLDSMLIEFCEKKKNRFDGYKIILDDIEFDVWDINNTWAFREKKVRCNKNQYLERLHETVFLNIDSILFNLSECKFIGEIFNDAIENKLLDIILEENPFIELNLLRAIIFKEKYNLSMSNRLVDSFKNYVSCNNNYLNALYTVQFTHYKEEKIKKNQLKDEIECILSM